MDGPKSSKRRAASSRQRPGPIQPGVNPATKVKLKRAAAVTRAAVPRYTREIIASVRESRAAHPKPDAAADLSAFESCEIGALWIGHATVLLRIGGLNILTDPVFSRRIGMSVGGVTFGMARVRPPAVDVDHLPRIDAILVSHAHFDHLDRPSLRRLELGPAKDATIITASNTRRLIPPGFPEIVELPWKRSLHVHSRLSSHKGVTVSAIRPEHWGARTALDRHRRFNSYLIESAHHRLLFAGDTAHTHAFDHVGPVDLAVFGIGAYDPWETAHATPQQVWGLYTRLSGGGGGGGSGGAPKGCLLPMHHSTFVLSREPLHEPLQRLKRAADSHAHHIVAETPGAMWMHG